MPSFFDIITFNHDFGKGWKLDTKSYTYGYSNHQHYQNNTDNDLITDSVLTKAIEEAVGGDDQPGWTPTTRTKPTGVDKLEPVRPRRRDRGPQLCHQVGRLPRRLLVRVHQHHSATRSTPTPSPGWIRPIIKNIKFHEHFLHLRPSSPMPSSSWFPSRDWTITAGVKDAFFRMNLTQYADGKTVGNLSGIEAACGASTRYDGKLHGHHPALPGLQLHPALGSRPTTASTTTGRSTVSTAAAALLPSAASSTRRRSGCRYAAAHHRHHLSGRHGGQAEPLRLRRGCLSHPLHQHLLDLLPRPAAPIRASPTTTPTPTPTPTVLKPRATTL